MLLRIFESGVPGGEPIGVDGVQGESEGLLPGAGGPTGGRRL